MAEPANYKDLRSESTCISRSTRRTADDVDGPALDATIILFIITSLVTSYRCFSRYTKRLWWHDDSVALFSTLFFIFFLIGSYTCFQFAAPNLGADGFAPATLGSIYLADGMVLHR